MVRNNRLAIIPSCRRGGRADRRLSRYLKLSARPGWSVHQRSVTCKYCPAMSNRTSSDYNIPLLEIPATSFQTRAPMETPSTTSTSLQEVPQTTQHQSLKLLGNAWLTTSAAPTTSSSITNFDRRGGPSLRRGLWSACCFLPLPANL